MNFHVDKELNITQNIEFLSHFKGILLKIILGRFDFGDIVPITNLFIDKYYMFS